MRQPLIVAALSAVLLTACNSSTGLDATLDASKGFDLDYHVSLKQAFADMSLEERNLYNEAVENLEQADFVYRFGKKTTARKVITGVMTGWLEYWDKELLKDAKVLAENATEVTDYQAAKAAKMLALKRVAFQFVADASEQNTCNGTSCAYAFVYKTMNPEASRAKLSCNYTVQMGAGVTYSFSDPCEASDGSHRFAFRGNETGSAKPIVAVTMTPDYDTVDFSRDGLVRPHYIAKAERDKAERSLVLDKLAKVERKS